MKKLFALIAALALPLLCAAQEDENQKANICAYWDKGDRIVYDCSETQYRIFIDGTVEEMGSATETHIIEVLDETDKSYHLRFSYQDVYDKSSEGTILGEVVAAITGNLSFEILTDELGIIDDLANEETVLSDMRNKIPSLVDGVLSKYSNKQLKEEEIDRNDLVTRFQGLFNDSSFIINCSNKSLTPLLFYHGVALDINKEYTTDQSFYQILGDGELTLSMKYWINADEADDTFVIIRSYAEASEEQMKPLVGDDDLLVSMEEYSAIQIHVPSGWPTEWYNKRVYHVANLEDEDDGGDIVHEKSFKFRDITYAEEN